MSPEENADSSVPSIDAKPRKLATPGSFVRGDPRINRTIPGPGRPPKDVRSRSIRIYDRILDVYEDRLDSGELATEKLDALNGAANVLGRYGLGTEDRSQVATTVRVIRDDGPSIDVQLAEGDETMPRISARAQGVTPQRVSNVSEETPKLTRGDTE